MLFRAEVIRFSESHSQELSLFRRARDNATGESQDVPSGCPSVLRYAVRVDISLYINELRCLRRQYIAKDSPDGLPVKPGRVM